MPYALINPEVLCWKRQNIGYSIEKAADLIGVSTNELSDWEQGHSNPSFEVAEKIAKLYDCGFDELYSSHSIGLKGYVPGYHDTVCISVTCPDCEQRVLDITFDASDNSKLEHILSINFNKKEVDQPILPDRSADPQKIDLAEIPFTNAYKAVWQFLTANKIRFVKDVVVPCGHGDFHEFHFIIPGSPFTPERLIETCDILSPAAVKTFVLKSYWIEKARGEDIKRYIVVYDGDTISGDDVTYCYEHGILVVAVQDLDAIKDSLTA